MQSKTNLNSFHTQILILTTTLGDNQHYISFKNNRYFYYFDVALLSAYSKNTLEFLFSKSLEKIFYLDFNLKSFYI